MQKIADEIRASERCDLRIAMVNYRDHPPQDTTYVTQVNNFTDNMAKTKAFIQATCACGGGDGPEAVCCGLDDCLNTLTWRDDSTKIAILIADAQPHGLKGRTNNSQSNNQSIQRENTSLNV